MRVICAIPCLDEEVAIGSVVLKAKKHVDDVLVIDDGSKDSTSDVARLAGARIIRHDKNKGKGAAYATLWKEARDGNYDALVVLDGDGQHDADEIPLLLAKLSEGVDLVIGARWGERTQMPWWRRVGKRVLDYGTALGSLRGKPMVTDSQSGFRAYSRPALSGLQPRDSGFAVESQTLMDAVQRGLSIGEVAIHCRYDVDGSSAHAVTHAGGVLNDILLQVAIRHPLLLLGLPGFLALGTGLGMGAYAVWIYQTDAVFAPAWVLLSATFVIVGTLGVFAGILFNVLPRILNNSSR